MVSRPFIDVLKSFNRKLTGVEIGVYRGENAISMLCELNIERLYLVDPYLVYPEYTGAELAWTDLNQLCYDNFYADALRLVEPFKDKVIFLREKSEDAISKISQVDFVYIDGNHAYEFVKKDLKLYYPKVKLIIGGDNLEYNSVSKAVIEFVFSNNLELHGKSWKVAYEWWIFK